MYKHIEKLNNRGITLYRVGIQSGRIVIRTQVFVTICSTEIKKTSTGVIDNLSLVGHHTCVPSHWMHPWRNILVIKGRLITLCGQ